MFYNFLKTIHTFSNCIEHDRDQVNFDAHFSVYPSNLLSIHLYQTSMIANSNQWHT